jgi:hypothetical protein
MYDNNASSRTTDAVMNFIPEWTIGHLMSSHDVWWILTLREGSQISAENHRAIGLSKTVQTDVRVESLMVVETGALCLAFL